MIYMLSPIASSVSTLPKDQLFINFRACDMFYARYAKAQIDFVRFSARFKYLSAPEYRFHPITAQNLWFGSKDS